MCCDPDRIFQQLLNIKNIVNSAISIFTKHLDHHLVAGSSTDHTSYTLQGNSWDIDQTKKSKEYVK